MAAVAGNSKLFGWISGLGMLSKAGSSCESELNGVCVCFFCLMALFFFGTISGWHLCAGFRHKAVEGGERLKKKMNTNMNHLRNKRLLNCPYPACLDWIQQSSLFSARIYDWRVATKLAGCASRQLVLPIIWPSKYPKEMVIVLNYGVNQLCKGTWSV